MPFDPSTARPVFDPSTARPIDSHEPPTVGQALTDPEFWTRDIASNALKQLPAIGGLAAGLAGPPGLMASAGLTALGAGAGSLVGQATEEIPHQIAQDATPSLTMPSMGEVAGEAALAGGSTLAAGGMFRLLFGNGSVDDVAKQAIDYAKLRKLPAPAPGGRAGAARAAGRATVLGDIEFSRQAAKIGQFIDDEVSALGITQNVDEVAEVARKLLLKNFDPRLRYKEIKAAIPADLPVSMDDTIEALRGTVDNITVPTLKETATAILHRLEVNPVTVFDDADGVMTQLYRLRSPGENQTIETLVNAVKDDIAAAAGSVPELASRFGIDGVQAAYNEAGKHSYKVVKALQDVPQLKLMMREGMSPAQFLAKFSTSSSIRAALKETAPEVHDQLARAWLGRNAERYLSKPAPDGAGFSRFLAENQKAVREMFGGEQVEALTNFAAYVRYAGESVRRAGGTDALMGSAPVRAARLAGEMKLWKLPKLLTIEGGGFAVVNRLMTPGSGLFQLFAEGAPAGAAVAAGVPATLSIEAINEAFRQ